MSKNNIEAFFALLRAGLWEKEVQLAPYGNTDYAALLAMAEEQCVVGLVAAGIEHVVDVRPAKKDVLQFIGRTVQLEQRNRAMNNFIGVLVEKMRKAGIYTLLVKGQGIAQCYERPLWRCSGDIDLFLSEDNYLRAKEHLLPLASSVEEEFVREKHLGMTINGWVVELHGHLYSGLSSKVEKELDALQKDTFYEGQVRSWMNGKTQVFMLKAENDAFYVFTHILQHFYKGGIGLRQICDWIRLIWTYRESIDLRILETRIRQMGLMSEWKAFAAMAVDYIGMPATAMPFYDKSSRWSKKAKRIIDFILMSGNFGHNRDMSYMDKHPYVIRKTISLGRRIGDMFRHVRIFPADSLRFFPYMMFNGVMSAMRGE